MHKYLSVKPHISLPSNATARQSLWFIPGQGRSSERRHARKLNIVNKAVISGVSKKHFGKDPTAYISVSYGIHLTRHSTHRWNRQLNRQGNDGQITRLLQNNIELNELFSTRPDNRHLHSRFVFCISEQRHPIIMLCPERIPRRSGKLTVLHSLRNWGSASQNISNKQHDFRKINSFFKLQI